jgi:predicted small lipoprotein YifL
MTLARLLIPICIAGLIAGCGQKGPLVHPDAPKHKKVVPAPRSPAADPAKPTDAPPKP